MSFGQSSGPPASAKQTAHLLSLLEADGYDFATGRHHYGLNQRQARGKFTAGEATELIERLEAEAETNHDTNPAANSEPQPSAPAPSRRALVGIPAEVLADELVRRGWVVIPPA